MFGAHAVSSVAAISGMCAYDLFRSCLHNWEATLARLYLNFCNVFYSFYDLHELIPRIYLQKVLEVIADNQVVVISGETGCGKTTQVCGLRSFYFCLLEIICLMWGKLSIYLYI